MPFKEMKFKGKKVFVEVDSSGDIIREGHRARIKYRLDDDRIYRPFIENLTPSTGDEPKEAAVRARKTTARPDAAVKSRETGAAGRSCVTAFTDGACLGNPGPAGAGYLILFPDGRRVARGEPLGQGTNNIAELTAILRVLETVEDKTAPLVIFSDSSYSLGVLTRGWKAKANQALIADIKRALRGFSSVRLEKVKGHAGVPENELVDELARTAAERQETV
jgi:ribonuclease HI